MRKLFFLGWGTCTGRALALLNVSRDARRLLVAEGSTAAPGRGFVPRFIHWEVLGKLNGFIILSFFSFPK